MGDTQFYEFGRIPHLAGDSLATADDKHLSTQETRRLLAAGVNVTEKVDGSLSSVHFDGRKQPVYQTRAHIIENLRSNQHQRWGVFVRSHTEILQRVLGDKYCMFVELLTMPHGVEYNDPPPEGFCVLELLDRTSRRFLSRERMEAVLHGTGFPLVPEIVRVGEFRDVADLISKCHGPSRYGAPVAEGVVVKQEDERLGIVVNRAKYRDPDHDPGCLL